MEKILITEQEIKNIKKLIDEITKLSIIEAVYLLPKQNNNNQFQLNIVVLTNDTIDYYKKFIKDNSNYQQFKEKTIFETKQLLLLLNKYDNLNNHYLSIITDTTTNYKSHIDKLANTQIIFDRFGELTFLQKKYLSSYQQLLSLNPLISNLEDILYEFTDNQTKEKFYNIKHPYLNKFISFLIEQYHIYGQKPHVLIKNIELLTKDSDITGYAINLLIDNSHIRISNIGLNNSMILIEEEGIIKYYDGFKITTTEYELTKDTSNQTVWYSDKGLRQYKINFQFKCNNYFIVHLKCDNHYYILNEHINLINYLKNNHISINNSEDLYQLIIKFINPFFISIKITDKLAKTLTYDHNILVDSQTTIISKNNQNIKKRKRYPNDKRKIIPNN